MKRWAGFSIVVIVVGLFAFLVPVVPSSPFPLSQFCSYICHSVGCGSFCGSTMGAPNVYGSIIYRLFGYGGVVMPNHAYLVITNAR